MTKYTPNHSIPYAEPTDYINNYPGSVDQLAAVRIDNLLHGMVQPILLNDEHLDTLTTPNKTYIQSSSVAAKRALGYPVDSRGAGWLEVIGYHNTNWNMQRYTCFDADDVPNSPHLDSGRMYVRTRTSATNPWSEWHRYIMDTDTATHTHAGLMSPADKQNLDSGSTAGGSDVMLPHSIRRTLFMQAMGGPIDTGGRGAVAFRVDHGFANFSEKLLPLFRDRGIVPSMVYNPRRWDSTENEGVTATDLNQWVTEGDVEVWNHGATHADAQSLEALEDEIVNSLHEIETQIPAAAGKVFGFAQPGVDPTTGYGGYGNGATPEKWDTPAGRLILKHHAVAAAYIPGSSLRVLDGDPRSGLGHMTMETSTVASLKSWIDVAITRRQGLQLMIHPSLLDTPGYMTTAQFTEVIDYVVEKRTAGALVTLSPYQLLVADSTTPAPYESEWRDITSLLGVSPSSGTFLVRRQGDTVHVQTVALTFDTAYPTFVSLGSFFPAGFRPSWDTEIQPTKRHDQQVSGPLRIGRSGAVYIYAVTAGQQIRTYGSFFTDEAPPTTLPGIPG